MSAFRILFDTLPTPGTHCLVPPEQVHHLVRVRRVGVGDTVECLDRTGTLCAAVVKRIDKDEVTLHLAPGCMQHPSSPHHASQSGQSGHNQHSASYACRISASLHPVFRQLRVSDFRFAPTSIILYPSLLPESKFDLTLQKCTEIGVAACVPVVAARNVARIDASAAAKKIARWQKICDEAARQCGGAPMRVHAPVSFRDAIATEAAVRIIADAGGTALAATDLDAKHGATAAVLVGPEGGFTPDEIEAARTAGWQCVAFHDNIMRAETAAVVCCALVQFHLSSIIRRMQP